MTEWAVGAECAFQRRVAGVETCGTLDDLAKVRLFFRRESPVESSHGHALGVVEPQDLADDVFDYFTREVNHHEGHAQRFSKGGKKRLHEFLRR